MTDQAVHVHGRQKIDKAWLAIGLIFAALAVLSPNDLVPTMKFTANALGNTGVYIGFAVLLVAFLKASGAEGIVASAFKGNQLRMIFLAAMLGGLAPFCSCEVIPFIAAMLAMGVPLSAVMAFWLSAPIMDPPMFLITTGALGFDFAVAKTVAAVGFGLFGGLSVMALNGTRLFADPLRSGPAHTECSSCGSNPFIERPVWAFWTDTRRIRIFLLTARNNAVFLFKWMMLAYLIESLMVRFIPASWIAGVLGGEGFTPILLGALVGAPAYLNGYAAAPLVAGLIDQGMSQGAAMSFMMAGAVSSIPAAIAVWALVKPKIFAAYIFFGFTGSLTAGLIWAAWTQV